MKTALLALVAGAMLLFAIPAQSEARPWRYYGWGPRPYYRAYYRPVRVYPAPYRVYRPYVYGPDVYYNGPGVSVGVW